MLFMLYIVRVYVCSLPCIQMVDDDDVDDDDDEMIIIINNKMMNSIL
jgi:hypothetical protein